MKWFSDILEKKWWLVQFLIYLFFAISHLFSLTSLPVFADESIYIRWSQLIIDDWHRYLFFALNDGKTPLFIWVVVPFLKLFENQLFASRLVAVIVGAFQVFVMRKLIEVFGGAKIAQSLGMIGVTVLPFWYTYHRMALMDGLLTLFISTTLLFLIKTINTLEKKQKNYFVYVFLTGISFGLAILTKLPALFFSPIFVLVSVYPFSNKHVSFSLRKVILVGIAGFIGCLLFVLLKLNPAFGQLFSRGRDFSYSLNDLIAGDWVKSISNIRIFSTWFLYYFSPLLTIFFFIGFALKKTRKLTLFLLISLLIFWAPFIILGKVVYPRYLFPTAVFITILISVVAEKALDSNKLVKTVCLISLIGLFSWSLYFMLLSLFNSDKTPFIAADRVQYLTEWSSGHGINQAVEFIQEKAKNNKVLVATEGRFGTLPDGILLNLHNQDVSNIQIWELGVAPVRELPSNFEERAKTADMTFLLVNSHRMLVNDDRLHRVESYSRPYNAPTFDIYEFIPYEKN